MSGTDFAQLTPTGQLRRLHALVESALAHYDLPVTSVQLHAHATNFVYRVRAADGATYAFRLAYPGWRALSDLRAEAAWLEALARDTAICAPRLVRAREGTAVLSLQAPGVPGVWYGTLMTWLPGRLLAHALAPANLAAFGALFAQLHQHGAAWQPPADFSTRRFAAFLSRDEPDVIFSAAVLDVLPADTRETLLTARAWVEQEYARLDPGDLRVIHCDLWHENVKVHGGQLCPFDFEDTVWGFRLHDLAMGLLDLLETVGQARYSELLPVFRAGYEQYLPWPAGNLEVLQIGRLLWKANYIARFEPNALPQAAAHYGHVFRAYEQQGELLRITG